MRMRALLPVIGLISLTAIACSGSDAAPDTATTPPAAAVAPDLEAVARNIVAAVHVKEGDRVQIAGLPRDLELIENIATEVEKAGGFPLPLLSTERMARRYYDEVPEKYDGRRSPWGKLLFENADVIILLDQIETPDLLANVDPKRTSANAEANAPNFELVVKRGVRTIVIGNGLYPTHSTAAQFGMTRDELASLFWAGLSADPAAIRAQADKLVPLLVPGAKVHVTSATGTDVSFTIAGKTPFVNAGVLSDEDLKAGGARVLAYVPAGEVFTLVTPGSAQGRIVMERFPFEGKVVEGLTIDVSQGKLTNLTARSGGERLEQIYDASGAGKELLSSVDFGVNPALQALPGTKLINYIPSGMVTLQFGNDAWVGGTNNVAFGLPAFTPGATVTIDGRTVIEAGVLKL